ncbi:isoleucine--tRNA ligase, cytoplasmic-like [Oscarella lobularis]|uniref:isoleucine--tRNA ligase, cytoplasmic-like n=1 Tax=Oscarella lobularis TaxID=121494 RepID=UPI0033137F15
MSSLPDSLNFPKEEKKILALWKELDAFRNCLKQSKGKPRYTFYDGPPFATGLPHYGHILAGTIKDIVTRYAHQTGHHVERRFGWDCHGLPVEYEIDKTLGITGPDDVKKMGIEKYNSECRKIVMRYSKEWEFIVSRLGRWIDFENDYKTLYPWFMETVWWVFKQLFDKGLVYRGFKVMPYSTACSTPLSNFESNQNYKDVTDPAVIVSFPLDESPDVSIIAWTTTPWTLPSNLAVCVHPTLTYVKVKDKSTGRIYIMMEKRLEALFKHEDEYEVLKRFQGKELEGKSYEPLFPYFAKFKEEGAFVVLTDTYVTEESGTGIVHQAPAFGEDDYRIAIAKGVIKKGQKLPCPVDDTGKFTSEVTHFAGNHVKDADKFIVKHLKENGRLVHSGTYKHSYPFCWRSETPLIYKAVPSWFIQVEKIVDQLLANNKKCYWVPEFVREKRFHNWLESAHDWAVSRNRYWGTPIPIWISDDFEEVVCVGSIDELEKLSGVRIKDLHRETVDSITIPSTTGRGELKRISEVFDCWFESGSMPYAQTHYPFEHKREFESAFPADFIAEGVDQTRGWFYTLLVISTALFAKPPYKNLIVNGLVLASDGRKMSKRLKNYPDPQQVVDKYGADALRLYLINSPVVRAETLRFKEAGVKDVVKDVFLPWYNAFRFLLQNVERFERENGSKFKYNESETLTSENYMDKWIVSFAQSLVKFMKEEMAAYRLYTVVPRLVKFIDMLTNWYVRSNRKRIKGETTNEDCLSSLQTLFDVLYTMIRIMAPFTPFLTELLYQNLKHLINFNPRKCPHTQSVHYLMFPEPNESLIDRDIENAVQRMQAVIELGRVIRDRKTLPTKYPLPEVVVIHKDEKFLTDVQHLEGYIKEELNVRCVTTASDREKYGVKLRAVPDSQELGRRLKNDFKKVADEIKKLTDEQLKKFEEDGKIEVAGITLGLGDIKVGYVFSGSSASQYEAHSDGNVLVLLDVTPDQSLLDEGVAREVVNKIQKLRKSAKLQPSDDVVIVYEVSGSARLNDIVSTHREYIEAATKQPLKRKGDPLSGQLVIEEKAPIKGISGSLLHLWIYKPMDGPSSDEPPNCLYCNVALLCDGTATYGTILLENPVGKNSIGTRNDLAKQIGLLFNLRDRKFHLSCADASLDSTFSPTSLHKRLVVVRVENDRTSEEILRRDISGPVVPFLNVSGDGDKVKGCVILKNPTNGVRISISSLKKLVRGITGFKTTSLSGKVVLAGAPFDDPTQVAEVYAAFLNL